jgi:hypothetical protein
MEGDRFIVMEAMSRLIEGTKVGLLIDRDGMTEIERAEAQAKGYRVLSRRQIESYLFDDENLRRLCESLGQTAKIDDVLAAKQDALAASQANGHPADDMKSASGRLFNAMQKF